MSKYEFFWKSDSPFSQWHRKPGKIQFVFKEYQFECAEQAMMWSKAVLMGDEDIAKLALKTPNAKDVKALGRKVKNFDPILWDTMKKDIVYQINLAKFSQNSDLKKILLATGDKTLAEASPYDKIWGIGLTEHDPLSQDEKTWKGQNLLGYALTKVKKTLRN